MTIFKTFLKVLNKCKAPILLYTVILIFFTSFNMKTNENTMSFSPSKPKIIIVNKDEFVGVTNDLITYLSTHCEVVEIENIEEKRNDALFYRSVNFIVEIPQNFHKDLLSKKNPTISIKSLHDYASSLVNRMLERYLNIANSYLNLELTEEELIGKINETLTTEVKVEIKSELDTESLNKMALYFNFTNYCILAGTIYVLCLILSSFKNKSIQKRTIISSIPYKKYNRILLFSNSLFAFLFWLFYILLSLVLIGKNMFTMHGLFYILNSFVFTFCALTLSFLLGNIVTNKNALNGIINVIALGSSFLCGTFVPMEWLPNSVLFIAHVLPSYYFIKTNEILKTLEVFDFESLKPIFLNMGVLLLFALGFVIGTNILSKKKQKLA